MVLVAGQYGIDQQLKRSWAGDIHRPKHINYVPTHKTYKWEYIHERASEVDIISSWLLTFEKLDPDLERQIKYD